jgi:BirA family biotin operon repressor/biotin-[acetyl-CoA-carboxylase] ligase
MIIGSNLMFFENLSSTNTYTIELLKKSNQPEGTIVYANFQYSGRGYSENKWESDCGKNLLISIVLYPAFINPADQFYISMSLSLGIWGFISRFLTNCHIKWPNDIYVNDDKIAGILIENSVSANRIEYCVAGIGININQVKFSDNIPNPVSLCQLTGISYDLTSCLKQLATDLDIRYKQLIAGNSVQLKEEYISKLYRLNKWFEFRDSKGIFTGRILNITEYGHLQVETKKGELNKYAFKEIEFII